MKALPCSPTENDLGQSVRAAAHSVLLPEFEGQEPEGPETDPAPTTTVACHSLAGMDCSGGGVVTADPGILNHCESGAATAVESVPTCQQHSVAGLA